MTNESPKSSDLSVGDKVHFTYRPWHSYSNDNIGYIHSVDRETIKLGSYNPLISNLPHLLNFPRKFKISKMSKLEKIV